MSLKKYLKILPLCLFLFTSSLTQAQPCEFSWDRIVNSSGPNSNFISPVASQPYQGPCKAFAYTGALEAMAKIESNNPNYAIDLDVPYFDFLNYGDGEYEIEDKFEAGMLIASNGCGNFPPGCTNEEEDCEVFVPIKFHLNHNAFQCFDIVGDTVNGYSVSYTYTPPSSAMDWYGAQQVQDNYSSSITTDDIKNIIMNEGPVVTYINAAVHDNYRNYVGTVLGFHSFLIIGWQDEPGGTRWKVRDSWPGMSGIHLTELNPGLADDVKSYDAVLTTVSGIYKSGQSPNTQFPNFNEANQCVVDRTAKPVVNQLYFAQTPVVQNEWNDLVAHATSDVDFAQWQFSTPSSAAGSIWFSSTTGWAERPVRCYVDDVVTFGARVKSEFGVWSNWKYITVTVQAPSGGGGGGGGPW